MQIQLTEYMLRFIALSIYLLCLGGIMYARDFIIEITGEDACPAQFTVAPDLRLDFEDDEIVVWDKYGSFRIPLLTVDRINYIPVAEETPEEIEEAPDDKEEMEEIGETPDNNEETPDGTAVLLRKSRFSHRSFSYRLCGGSYRALLLIHVPSNGERQY